MPPSVTGEGDPQALGLGLLGETRQSVVLHLRQSGGASASELAAAIGVTPGAMRQQLARLQALGVVEHSPASGRVGRPAQIFRVSAAGDRMFPSRYESLAGMALDRLATINDAEVAACAAGFVNDSLGPLAGAQAGPTNAAAASALAGALNLSGFLAVHDTPLAGTEQVSIFHCPILAAARRFPVFCQLEQQLLAQAAPTANVRRIAHMVAGHPACSYAFTETDTPGKGKTGRGPRDLYRHAAAQSSEPQHGPAEVGP